MLTEQICIRFLKKTKQLETNAKNPIMKINMINSSNRQPIPVSRKGKKNLYHKDYGEFTSFFDNCLIDIAGKEIPAVPSVFQPK